MIERQDQNNHVQKKARHGTPHVVFAAVKAMALDCFVPRVSDRCTLEDRGEHGDNSDTYHDACDYLYGYFHSVSGE